MIDEIQELKNANERLRDMLDLLMIKAQETLADLHNHKSTHQILTLEQLADAVAVQGLLRNERDSALRKCGELQAKLDHCKEEKTTMQGALLGDVIVVKNVKGEDS